MRQPTLATRASLSLSAVLFWTSLTACEASVVHGEQTGGTTVGGTAAAGTAASATTSAGSDSGGSGAGSGTGASNSASSAGGGTTGANTTTGGGTGGTTGGELNQPCSTENGLDSCVAVGLVCTFSTDPAHTGTVCELPGEFQPCQVPVGCNNPGLQCLSFSTGSFCFVPCNSSNDCPTLYTTCLGGPPGVCYLASCTPEEGADGGFASCDAASAGDGTCIPSTTQALCLQGGTAAPGDICDSQRGAGVTSADLCAPNSACIPGGISGAGHCAPLCGIDGGRECPDPTFCQPSGAGDWGYCL